MEGPSSTWSLETEDVGDVTVVRFSGRHLVLDVRNVHVLGERFFGLIEESGRCRLVLDFSNVEYLFSDVLAKLISLQKRILAAGGKLMLCNLKPQVYEIFEVTRLKDLFDIRQGSPVPLNLRTGEGSAN